MATMDQNRLERWYAGIEAGDQAVVEDTKRAAKEGSAEDDYLLAVLFASGVTVPMNLEAALRHLQSAAQRGHAAAKGELAALAGESRPVQAFVADWLRLPDGQALSMSPRVAIISSSAR